MCSSSSLRWRASIALPGHGGFHSWQNEGAENNEVVQRRGQNDGVPKLAEVSRHTPPWAPCLTGEGLGWEFEVAVSEDVGHLWGAIAPPRDRARTPSRYASDGMSFLLISDHPGIEAPDDTGEPCSV